MMVQVVYPKYLSKAIIRHLLFWVFIIAFFTSPDLFSGGNISIRLVSNLCYVPLDMMAVYFTLYIFLPMIMKRRQFVIAGLLYILMVVALALLSKLLKEHVYTFLPPVLLQGSVERELFNSTLVINMIVGMAVGAKLLMLWYAIQLKSKEMENQQTRSELAHLRSQLNPHFLFNTLNNIDSLVLNDPERASETLIKLSDILRYSIYETVTDKVVLEKELEYLQNYIDLQRIRINQPDFVRFNINGSANGLEVAPMLLIPLVENAFKHGDRKVQAPGIIIDIRIHSRSLELSVENGIKNKSGQDIELYGGIGLNNVKRRLDLQYRGKYELNQHEYGDKYFIRLTLDLT